MSARVCELCGKPLSRIRVGTEGNFCSREHRNQFRLRQGMDRLMEANNVANLMRRRELPKIIVSKPIESSTSMEWRSYSQGISMPARPGVIIKSIRLGSNRGKGPRLGHSGRAQIALVRFNVLETEGARHEMPPPRRASQSLFLLAKQRRGGMRSSERPAAPARKPKFQAQRGDLLRVSGNAGFVLRSLVVRHVRVSLSTQAIRPKAKRTPTRPLDRESQVRAQGEQWSALRTRLYVAEPNFSFHQPWNSLRPGPRDIPGSNTAAGTVPAGPGAARVAQVRIELQEGMRYAISTEEDRA